MRLLVFFMLLGMSVSAYSATEKDSLNVPFKDRIAIHTNSVGWLMMTPNLGVEYSFVQNDLEKVSALVHARYNPNSLKTFNPRLVYNILGARAEVRWYARLRYISQGEQKLDSLELAKYGRFKAFWNKLTTRSYSLLGVDNPQRHRAYYLGPYLAYDKYTMKLFKKGYQGFSVGFGATAGYSIPLYQYKNGSAIDFELGFSAGFAMSKCDMFYYYDDVDCYAYAGSKAFHFVPFPVITDARVGFVYRMKSIRDQILDIDQPKIDGYAAIYELRKSYDEKILNYIYPYHIEPVVQDGDTIHKKMMHEEYLASDSIKAWNKVIEEKNNRIREINKIAMLSQQVDSAMLLEELRPCYEYVEIPEKMFAQYNHVIPNKDIKSVAELDNEYLNALMEKYAIVDMDVVKEETGIGQVEDPLLFSYSSLRSKMLEKNDSVTGIRLIELMVQSVSNVNSNVRFFNTKYNISSTGKEIGYDAMPAKMEVITGEAGKGYGLDFVFGVDTLALATPQSYSFKALNDEIEARNVYKFVKLEEIVGPIVTQSDAEQAAKSKDKAKKEGVKKEKTKKSKAGKKAKSAKSGDADKEAADTEKVENAEIAEDGGEDGKEGSAKGNIDASSLSVEESSQSNSSQDNAGVVDALEQNLELSNAP